MRECSCKNVMCQRCGEPEYHESICRHKETEKVLKCDDVKSVSDLLKLIQEEDIASVALVQMVRKLLIECRRVIKENASKQVNSIMVEIESENSSQGVSANDARAGGVLGGVRGGRGNARRGRSMMNLRY